MMSRFLDLEDRVVVVSGPLTPRAAKWYFSRDEEDYCDRRHGNLQN
jgi:hypothetical protein